MSGGDSENWSQYESGSYAGGSYAFTSISYQDQGSDSSTLTDKDTTSGTFTSSGNDSFADSGGVGVSVIDAASAGASDSLNNNERIAPKRRRLTSQTTSFKGRISDANEALVKC